MTGRGINTVRIGDEVKHITELDALTLMHEWSKLTKENADLYDYNRQVYIKCLIFNIKRIMRTKVDRHSKTLFLLATPHYNGFVNDLC